MYIYVNGVVIRNNLAGVKPSAKLKCAAKYHPLAPVLQHMEKLKAENAKIKEENRALTRVVAKLSK